MGVACRVVGVVLDLSPCNANLSPCNAMLKKGLGFDYYKSFD